MVATAMAVVAFARGDDVSFEKILKAGSIMGEGAPSILDCLCLAPRRCG